VRSMEGSDKAKRIGVHDLIGHAHFPWTIMIIETDALDYQGRRCSNPFVT
jgi:hypothetical protein